MSITGTPSNNSSTIRGVGNSTKLGNDINQDTGTPQQPSFTTFRNPKLNRPVVGTDESFRARATMIEDDNEVYTFSIPVDTLAVNQYLMVSQYEYAVDDISIRFTNQSAAASDISVVKVSSGSAISSGTLLIASARSLADSADTNDNISLSLSSDANRKIAKGEALALKFGGTVTGVAGLSVTISLRRLIPATRNSSSYFE